MNTQPAQELVDAARAAQAEAAESRAKHLAWCKQRATEYVDMGDLGDAMASMISDLGKHEDTAALCDYAAVFMAEVMSGDARRVQSFIDGSN